MKKVFTFIFFFTTVLIGCSSNSSSPSPISANTATPLLVPIPEPTQTVSPPPIPFLDAIKFRFVTLNAITPIESTIYADQTDYWVVGDQGFITHWMGGYPLYGDSPAGSLNLYDVDFVSPDNGWIVGEDEVILHWNGDEWEISKSSRDDSGWPYSYSLYNVAFAEEDDGWAAGCVGSEGGEQILVYHWDGTAWSQVSLPEELLFWVCIHDIAAISPRDVWMVGTGWDEGNEHGVALHWDGNTWESFSEGDSFVIHSISVLSPDNIWAVTRYGIIWNWNGVEWSEKVQLDFTGLEGSPVIFARGPDDLLVAGNKIFHWNGSNWMDVSLNSNLPADMNVVDIVEGGISEGGNPFIYMLDSSGIMYSFAKESFR